MIRNENNIAALAAITTIWPTMRNVFFPAKAATPIAPVTSLGMDADLIDKFHVARNVHQRPRQVDPDFALWRQSAPAPPGIFRSGSVIS